MKSWKRLRIVSTAVMASLLGYLAGYLCYVRPMPVRVAATGPESVEPVFQTASHGIIRLFRPVVGIDRALFPGRWELARFQMQPTDLEGFRKMAPFRARVEGVGRSMPYTTRISTLHLGLRLESGHLLPVDADDATEQMFAKAGSLMDSGFHEFPAAWFEGN